jgi:hypothetical protein
MSIRWKSGVALLTLALVVGLIVTFGPARSALSYQGKDGGAPRYTVVATDGAHLIVTDNQTSKVYFYAIEKDGKPGDEMKFRGSIDLTKVGEPTITPTKAK